LKQEAQVLLGNCAFHVIKHVRDLSVSLCCPWQIANVCQCQLAELEADLTKQTQVQGSLPKCLAKSKVHSANCA